MMGPSGGMGPPPGMGHHPGGPGGPGHRRQPVDKKELKELQKNDLKFVVPFVKAHKKSFFWVILLTIFGTIARILPPYVLKIIIDEYLPAQNYNGILSIGLFLIGFYVMSYFINVSQNRLMTKTAQLVVHDIRNHIFEKFMKLPVGYYEEQRRGELLSVVTGDVNVLSDAVTFGLISFISDIISMVLVTFVMLSFDMQTGLLIVLILPISVIIIDRYRRKMRDNFFQIRTKVAQMNANIEENVSGIRVAQSLVVEKRNIQGFNQISQQNYDLRMQSTKMFAKMNAVMSITSFIGLGIVLGVGGYRTIIGEVGIGELLAFFQYTQQFTGQIMGIAGLSNLFFEAGAALLHIRKSTENAPEIPEPVNPISLPSHVNGEITLNHVQFAYSKEVPLFNDLNLTIEANEKIGIVGETGAGKSTLINLMTRLYDVNGGSIQIDHIDVRDIRQEDLRSLIAIVSQNVFLFSETILNNIKFGRPTATDKEVMDAAKMARADLFIEKMPLKYETKLGEAGVGLSGGQKQLIAYARLILAHPKIAILDEATSNIDSYTENLIQQNMKDQLKETTVIIIAHRFATLKNVNRIVVLKYGKIAAIGTHEELLQKNPYYRELCEKQFSKM